MQRKKWGYTLMISGSMLAAAKVLYFGTDSSDDLLMSAGFILFIAGCMITPSFEVKKK